jgi:hypothetical protein
MNRRALAGYDEMVLGVEHPNTLTSVSNLAGVLSFPLEHGNSDLLAVQKAQRTNFSPTLDVDPFGLLGPSVDCCLSNLQLAQDSTIVLS